MKLTKSVFFLVLTLFITALVIIIYFSILKNQGDVVERDFMNKKVINAPIIAKNCCSWWPISHFIAFTIYSLIWPQHSVLLFCLGIFWELVEGVINWLESETSTVVKHQPTRGRDGEVEDVEWWTASSKDVWFNLVGILFGRLLYFFITR